MSGISTFLANNYIWFLVVGIVLIFALIGYIVDSKNIKLDKPKTIKLNSDVSNPKSDAVEELKEEIKDKDITLNQATGNTVKEPDPVKTTDDKSMETLDDNVNSIPQDNAETEVLNKEETPISTTTQK